MLKNSSPDQKEDIIEPLATGGPKANDEDDEPEPPEPFEYTEDQVLYIYQGFFFQLFN